MVKTTLLQEITAQCLNETQMINKPVSTGTRACVPSKVVMTAVPANSTLVSDGILMKPFILDVN